MRQRVQTSRPGIESGAEIADREAGRGWFMELERAAAGREARDGGCGSSGRKKKAPCITHGAGGYSLLAVSHSIETPRTREKIASSKSATRRLPVSIRLIAI